MLHPESPSQICADSHVHSFGGGGIFMLLSHGFSDLLFAEEDL